MLERLTYIAKKIALALFYIFIYFALLFLITGYVKFLEEDVENYNGVVTILASVAALLIYRVIFYARGIKTRNYIGVKPISFTDAALSCAMAVGFRLLTAAYLIWSEHNIPLLEESIRQGRSYSFEMMTNIGAISIVISVCIAAPIFEEILFRGLVMKELSDAMGDGLAVVIQAVLFALAHAFLAQSVFAAVYGLILGIIYYRTKNIAVVILSHMFFNISSVLEIKSVDMLGKMVVTGMVLTMASIFIFFYIYKREIPACAGKVTGGNDNV